MSKNLNSGRYFVSRQRMNLDTHLRAHTLRELLSFLYKGIGLILHSQPDSRPARLKLPAEKARKSNKPPVKTIKPVKTEKKPRSMVNSWKQRDSKTGRFLPKAVEAMTLVLEPKTVVETTEPVPMD